MESKRFAESIENVRNSVSKFTLRVNQILICSFYWQIWIDIMSLLALVISSDYSSILYYDTRRETTALLSQCDVWNDIEAYFIL